MSGRLGYGASGVLGTRLITDQAVHDLIIQAYEGGITTFDTAPAYGAGLAEVRLGRALADLPRDQLTITTKAGLSSSGLMTRKRDFSPDGIEQSLHDSLSRLTLDYVDVLFLHGPAPEELTDELFKTLDRLKSAGLYKALGMAGRGPELDVGIAAEQIDHIMIPVHPFMTTEDATRLEQARTRSLPIWAIETSGPGKPALRWPTRSQDLFNLARSLKSRASAPDASHRVPVRDGLSAALQRDGLHRVLMTTSRPAHLRENLALNEMQT